MGNKALEKENKESSGENRETKSGSSKRQDKQEKWRARWRKFKPWEDDSQPLPDLQLCRPPARGQKNRRPLRSHRPATAVPTPGGFYRALTPQRRGEAREVKFQEADDPSQELQSHFFCPRRRKPPSRPGHTNSQSLPFEGSRRKKKNKPGSGPSFLEQPTPKELPPPQRVRLVGILGFETHLWS